MAIAGYSRFRCRRSGCIRHGSCRHRHFTTGFVDAFARVPYFGARFLTLLLASNALRFFRLPSFISAWACSLPLAAMTLATVEMSVRTGSGFYTADWRGRPAGVACAAAGIAGGQDDRRRAAARDLRAGVSAVAIPLLHRWLLRRLAAFAHPKDMMRRFSGRDSRALVVSGLGDHPLFFARHRRTLRRHCAGHTIARLNCPVLLVHGLRDDTVPFDDARRLLAAASDVRLLAVDADHDLSSAMATGHDAITGFLQASEQRCSRPSSSDRCATLSACDQSFILRAGCAAPAPTEWSSGRGRCRAPS